MDVFAFIFWMCLILIPVVIVNFWWTRRPERAAKAFRASLGVGEHAWLGQLLSPADLDLFETQTEHLADRKPAMCVVSAIDEGLKFELRATYLDGSAVPSVTIPWTKVNNAGLSPEQPPNQGILATPRGSRVSIAVSEKWMQDLEDLYYPVKREPSDEEGAHMEELAREYSEQDYEGDQRESYGNLYQPGLEMIDFDSHDIDDLIETIRSRARGIPERADESK